MPDRAFPQTHAGMVAALEFVEQTLVDTDSELRDRAVLVAGEALANAVEHDGENADSDIHIVIESLERQLELTIVRPNSGFDIKSVLGSDLPDDPLAMSGRGLFLIRTLADQIRPRGESGIRYVFHPRP